MIVAPQPAAAEVGLEVMRRGGNAVDAAVTCAFVQGVLDPQMCGIGGCGVMLVHSPQNGDTLLEFYATAGSRTREDQWKKLFIREAADRYGYVLEGFVNDVGYQSVGVPGTVAGLYEALSRFGTISWDQAIAPAIPLAREGIPVSGYMYGYWTTDYGPDVVPNAQRIQATPAAKAIYTRDGNLFAIGERFVQADYARTLERLARDGPETFYRGEIANEIASDFESNGGFVTKEDLAGYRVNVTEPLRGTYRGLAVSAAGPPAGGLTLLQMLNFLEGYDVGAHGWPSTEAARMLVQAMGWAVADREVHIADPRFVDIPTAALADKQYAARAREAAATQARAGTAGTSARVHDRADTTQVCVVDDAGNAVSLTHTLGSASGVVTPGLGFGYNDYMNCFDPRPGTPNSVWPGKTRVTMMTPTMVFEDGRLRVCVGAPGGTKIVTGVLQTLVNVLDHEMTPVEAVSAPRVDFQGDVVQVEARIPLAVCEGLERLGYKVNRRTLNFDAYFSRPQVIVSEKSGRLRGASDPRKDGGTALDTTTR
ncbi:MAG: gamma-glutamyltransferase [Candidatus Dormibacteraeota bacterium]|nr:gamma-glutamyltransferase [Candidatus Dormibacteraeota bacterium]